MLNIRLIMTADAVVDDDDTFSFSGYIKSVILKR